MQSSEHSQSVVWGIRWRILLPFVLLALMFSVVAGSFSGYILSETGEDRFHRQLADHAQQATNSIAGQQAQLLSVERRVANTQGVAQAAQAVEPEVARELVLPLAIDAQSDFVSVLQENGVSLVTVRREPGAEGNFATLRSEDYFLRWNEVQSVLGLNGEAPVGDKMIGLHQVAAGEPSVLALVVVGPLLSSENDLTGAVVVGEYLTDLALTASGQAGANVTVYDLVEGRPLSSTLDGLDPESSSVPLDLAADALFSIDRPPPVRPIGVAGQAHREVLLGLNSVQSEQPLAVMGVSLLDPIDSTGLRALAAEQRQAAIYLAAFGATVIILVLLLGLLLSNSIVKPIQAMTRVTSRVADGETALRLDEGHMGGVSALAAATNRLIEKLDQKKPIHEITTKDVNQRLIKLSLDGDETKEGSKVRRIESAVLSARFGIKETPASRSAVLESGEVELILGKMLPILAHHRGTLIGYEPFAYMAVFGEGLKTNTLPTAVESAVQAGSDLADFVHRLNHRRQENGNALLGFKLVVSAGEIRYIDDSKGLGGMIDSNSWPVRHVAEVMQALQGRSQDQFVLHETAFRYLQAGRAGVDFAPPRQLTVPGTGETFVVHSVVLPRPTRQARHA